METLSVTEYAKRLGVTRSAVLLQIKEKRLAKGVTAKKIGNTYSLSCLLYTSDAADDLLCVDLGGRRFIKKKQKI